MSGSITPTNPNAAQSSAPKGQVVQIVLLPDGLQNNARAMRIEGEVVQQNKDGSVRVHTDQGDIDIQVRGRQPQPGTKIEVDIPAGNPPRNATIRPAPVPVPAQPLPQTPTQQAPTIPLPQTPVTQPPSQQQPQPQAPTPVSSPQTPLQTTTQPAQANPDVITQSNPAPVTPPTAQPSNIPTASPQPTTLPPLTTGQIVQIIPLSEADMPQSLPQPALQAAPLPAGTQPIPSQTPTIIDRVSAQAALVGEKAQGSLISNILQAVKSVLPASSALATQAPNMTAPPDAILPAPLPAQTVLAPSITRQQPLVLSAKIMAIIPPLDQRIFVQPPATSPLTPVATPALTVATTQLQTASPEIGLPLLTVTITETTLQNKPAIALPMNMTGSVQNFVIQASAANTPPGTQITLLPQASPLSQTLQTANTAATPQTIAPQIPLTTTMPAAQASALPAAWRPLLPLMQATPLWPVLDDIFQSFYQATPQAAQILGRIIPSPANAQNFGPAVMLFAAALKSGDMQGWLGDKKLEMLQKLGKGDLVSRLSGESSSLSSNNDAPATDWKTYPFPLLYQNEISKVLFHVRREPDENAQQEQKDATHFVMDVSLPRMGNVQLDALVRGNQVDVVVRTELPVSAPMQDAMRTAYARALDNTTIYGDIGFQSDVKNFITITGRDAALASA